jgi:hypothetical protein
MISDRSVVFGALCSTFCARRHVDLLSSTLCVFRVKVFASQESVFCNILTSTANDEKRVFLR